MFGLGLSPLDKEIIPRAEQILASWGLSCKLSKSTARQIFEETKHDVKRREATPAGGGGTRGEGQVIGNCNLRVWAG
jgi:hypothetical protein